MCGRFVALSWDEVCRIAEAIMAERAACGGSGCTGDGGGGSDGGGLLLSSLSEGALSARQDGGALPKPGTAGADNAVAGAAAVTASRIDAFPKSVVPVIASSDGECPSARLLTWGFDLPGSPGKVAFNTRGESAAASPLWRESLARRRCVVPAAAFFEPHRSEAGLLDGRRVKQTYRFADAAGAVLLMAGIWQGDRFSVMTREPDRSVSPVHDRMPALLAPAQAKAWLQGQVSSPAGGIELAASPLYDPAPTQQQLSLF